MPDDERISTRGVLTEVLFEVRRRLDLNVTGLRAQAITDSHHPLIRPGVPGLIADRAWSQKGNPEPRSIARLRACGADYNHQYHEQPVSEHDRNDWFQGHVGDRLTRQRKRLFSCFVLAYCDTQRLDRVFSRVRHPHAAIDPRAFNDHNGARFNVTVDRSR